MIGKQISVTVGTPVIRSAAGLGGDHHALSIVAIPGGGGTALVEASNTPDANNPATSGVTWDAWTPGAVSSTTRQVFWGPAVAFRFTAATANAVFEVA